MPTQLYYVIILHCKLYYDITLRHSWTNLSETVGVWLYRCIILGLVRMNILVLGRRQSYHVVIRESFNTFNCIVPTLKLTHTIIHP